MQAQVRRVGGCSQPIRLRGRRDLFDTATGEVTEVWSTEELPDGTALVACGNRRASRCGPCSRLYQGDAYQLVVAGLRGGKTTPEQVAGHPALFATLTAPSFGPVHTRVLDPHGDAKTCRPAVGVCAHGRQVGCNVRHDAADPLLGQAICPGCFDYEAAVMWNAHLSELWRRTRIDLYRQLARLLGRTEKRVKTDVRVEYVKVAEYQRRGLLHYHAAIRLDSADDRGLDPPAEYTVDLLAQAIRAAVAHVEAPYPALDVDPDTALDVDSRPPAVRKALRSLPALDLTDRPGLIAARWGEQLHLDPILPDQVDAEERGGLLSRGQVAGYLAKYATKHTEALGGLDRRVTPADLPTLPVNPHITRLVTTALLLGIRVPALARLGRWAHQLGYGGHWLTKSRRWSTTFTALRATRRDWQHTRNPDRGEGQDSIGRWQYTGTGYRLPGDAALAEALRDELHLARIEARAQQRQEKEARELAA